MRSSAGLEALRRRSCARARPDGHGPARAAGAADVHNDGLKLSPSLALVALVALHPALSSCKGGRPRPESAPAASDAREASADAPAPLTYWGAVAPILEAHCTSCHAEGGIGPMPLASFADAKTHAGSIAYEVRTRHMPPWLPDTKACAPLAHARALAEEDIATLVGWAEAGAPEGDRSEYRARAKNPTYTAVEGEPGRVVMPAVAYAPKRARSDDYHCFVLDPKLTEPERVVALRIAPGLPSVVHHVLLYEVRAPAVPRIERLDAAEPGPGYTCFGGIGVVPSVRAGDLARGELVDFDAQMIVGWAPGAGATDVAGAPTKLPAGTAIKLAPGSRLVMQVHYSLENYDREKAKTDRTRVDLWLASRGEPLRQAVWVPLLDARFAVPKDAPSTDPRATARREVPLPLPLEVLGVAPHMHLRGKSIRIESIEDGARTCLLDVPRWDFHHQEGYWLEKGVRVDAAGLSCRWDNSPAAQPIVNGKRKPSRELRWGEGTDDEMCLAFLYATL